MPVGKGGSRSRRYEMPDGAGGTAPHLLWDFFHFSPPFHASRTGENLILFHISLKNTKKRYTFWRIHARGAKEI